MRKSIIFSLLLVSAALSAQTLSPDYLAYIEAYKQAAVDQEITHHIPASITLAQGLLESAAGKSELATKANNHFGIKCHSDWTGATFTHDDETKNECFRSYDDAAKSFNDHALFLMRPRYESLFSLPLTDYKGWAKGLKACGYATDPNYALKLIKIIEDYDLVAICETARYSAQSKATQEQVDKAAAQAQTVIAAASEEKQPAATAATAATAKKTTTKKTSTKSKTTRQHSPNIVDDVFATATGTQEAGEQAEVFKERKVTPAAVASVDLYQGHKVQRQGLRKYIVADAGDTYKAIAAEFNIELKRIVRYNRVSEYQKPQQGEKVYLNCKKP